MNVKKFLLSGIIGGIVYFLLGWLFYGIVFKSFFPSDGKENMLFIFLGCMTFGFFVSYIFTKWASISNPKTGTRAGAVIGLFLALFSNFFMNAMVAVPDYKIMVMDVAITTVMSALVGAITALAISKIK